MKKYALLVLALMVMFAGDMKAEDQPAANPPAEETAPAPAVTTSAAVEVVPAEAPATQETEEPAATENLEFVSGEVTAVDQASKTLTVKLYGETEEAESEKTISVKIHDTTDITDGEQDRDLASLSPGTEVDVEYDPATNTATYIFAY